VARAAPSSDSVSNDLYFPAVSSPTQPAARKVRVRISDRVRNFWQRVSEGRQLDDLWTQFAADARASYGFYGRDVDWEEIHKLPRWRRPLHVTRQFFWALLLKLSPARRVLLLIAFLLLVLSGATISSSNYSLPFFSCCSCRSSWPTKSP